MKKIKADSTGQRHNFVLYLGTSIVWGKKEKGPRLQVQVSRIESYISKNLDARYSGLERSPHSIPENQ